MELDTLIIAYTTRWLLLNNCGLTLVQLTTCIYHTPSKRSMFGYTDVQLWRDSYTILNQECENYRLRTTQIIRKLWIVQDMCGVFYCLDQNNYTYKTHIRLRRCGTLLQMIRVPVQRGYMQPLNQFGYICRKLIYNVT